MKRPVSLVIGIIVFVVAILGYMNYLKKYPLINNSVIDIDVKDIKISDKINEKIEKEKQKPSTSNEETESTKANRHMQFCLDWNASGGSDVSMSYAFYCDKNIVQRSVDVIITAKFNENNLFGKNSGKYTVADAEKEFRNRYCGKIKDCDISWDKDQRTISLKGTCKSNYAGLPKSTLEEFRSGWEITTAFNEICE